MTVPAPAPTLIARRAVVADAAELTRLRQVMFDHMGRHADDGWQDRCHEVLRAELAADRLVAFVVDAPDGGSLACGVVGVLDRRLPGPGSSGLVGHVSSLATDPAWRRRGAARLALEALLDWFRAAGATSVGLSATDVGEPLYRSLGFAEPPYPALRLRWPAPR